MMTHATIDRAQKYTAPTHSGDGYSFGGGAILALDVTITDGAGPRIARVSILIGEGVAAHAIADALVQAINDAIQDPRP